MGPIGAGAADQRAWNLIARPASLSRRAAPAAAKPARLNLAPKPTASMPKLAPPRRQGGDAHSTSRSCAAVGPGKRAGYGTRAAAGCLISALGGPYPDTKIAGRCRLVNRATRRVDQSLSTAFVSRAVAGRSVAGGV